MFAWASAQNYTQVFDNVFQHVDLSHTSTGILYERVLPLSNLVSYVTNISHPVDTCDYWQFVMAYDELYRAGGQYTFLRDSVEGMLRHLPGGHINWYALTPVQIAQLQTTEDDRIDGHEIHPRRRVCLARDGHGRKGIPSENCQEMTVFPNRKS